MYVANATLKESVKIFKCIANLNIPLFEAICHNELSEMLACFNARLVDFDRGAYLLMEGDKLSNIGIIVEGDAAVYKTDILGNRILFAQINPPHLFAEALLCAGITKSPVSVEAITNVRALFIPYRRIIGNCPKCCSYHSRLIHNLLKIVANKTISLTEKLDHLSHKTTRQKIAAYLLSEAVKSASNRFTIDFDRQALADYLCVNRSALSRELSGIGKEGIISSNRSSFIIHDTKKLEQILHDERSQL